MWTILIVSNGVQIPPDLHAASTTAFLPAWYISSLPVTTILLSIKQAQFSRNLTVKRLFSAVLVAPSPGGHT